MALKCVHSGCGKTYKEEDNEVCKYHPGPPLFHEGQKGWKCCKPKVLTFDEFMSIPGCTEGKHSTTDHPPKLEKKEVPVSEEPAVQLPAAVPRAPIALPNPATVAAEQPAPVVETDDDDPALEIPDGKTCRRRACGVTYGEEERKARGEKGEEKCVFHPGVPIFHEGTKGYTCCKRRVLEFDQFMKLEGCETKPRHLFIGSGKKGKGGKEAGGSGGEELLDKIRTDFYQSATNITASFFLKKIDKAAATVKFTEHGIDLDLPTADAKRYRATVPLFAAIDPAKSKFTILGTKLEVVLAKAEVSSWPVLRSDDRHTGEIIQVGRAGNLS